MEKKWKRNGKEMKKKKGLAAAEGAPEKQTPGGRGWRARQVGGAGREAPGAGGPPPGLAGTACRPGLARLSLQGLSEGLSEGLGG
jgi:hypothetical protein